MSGIGSIVNAWNSSHWVDSPAPREKGVFGMGASGLASFLKQTANAAPDDGSCATHSCCSRLLSPASMSAAIAAQIEDSARASMGAIFSALAQDSASAEPGMAQNVFTMLDADGDGMISRSEFDEGLFGTGAPVAPGTAGHCACGDEGDGVAGEDASSSDQTAGIATAEGGETSSEDAVATSDTTGADEPNSDVAQGGDASTDSSIGTPAQNSVTTTEATNADGSTSTTITYPDGTKVTLTTPPNSGVDGSSGLGPDHSPIESVLAMLIRLQAQMTEKVAA